MAMIDFGAITFKNGKLVTKDMFMDMKSAVGWTSKDYIGQPWVEASGDLNLDGNYFSFIGDKNTTLAFYRNSMTWVERCEDGDKVFFYVDRENFGYSHFAWKKWSNTIGDDECTVTKRNGYFVCKWRQGKDRYKVYFGFGVDLDYYCEHGIVNYYRSIPFLWDKYVVQKFKDRFLN